MRLLVWNINALIPTVKNFNLKHGSIRGFFDSYGADIICFQETKLVDEKLTSELACVEGYESYWAISETKKGYSGVATYVRNNWSPVAVEIDSLGILDSELSGEGRIIVTDHSSFVLINVYVPNAGKRGEEISTRANLKIRFLNALKEKCDDLRAEGRQFLLVGDMNIAATPKDVHATFNWDRMYHPEEMQIMRVFLKDYTDVWRHQNPYAADVFTVWDEKTSARSFNKGVRIDYVLVTPGLLPKMGPCEVLDTPPKWSDHAALVVDVNDVQPPPLHEPPAESSRRQKRFNSRRQPSIASLFARKKSETVQQAVELPGKATAASKTALSKPLASSSLKSEEEDRHEHERPAKRMRESKSAPMGSEELPGKEVAGVTRKALRAADDQASKKNCDSGLLKQELGEGVQEHNVRDQTQTDQVVALEIPNGTQSTSGKAPRMVPVKQKAPEQLSKGQKGIASFFAKSSKS